MGSWAVLLVLGLAGTPPPYPPSDFLSGISFDWDSHKRLAAGSDNWPITWADDDCQYTAWGDGGGFGGSDSDGRVSNGFARVEGAAAGYRGTNIAGGKDPPCSAPFEGKCYGVLSLRGKVYAWRIGSASGESAYEFQELWVSGDHGRSWSGTRVRFDPSQFGDGEDKGFFAPTFLQSGKDYGAARDAFVYMYAPNIKSLAWEINRPGEITLMRVRLDRIEDPEAYRFFTGLDESGNPIWSASSTARKPVWEDPLNGVMGVSAAFVPALNRVLLITEHTENAKGNIGIYEARHPWGPWRTVLFCRGWGRGHIEESTFFWNFAPKWFSEDGMGFVLVFTGTGDNDSWNTVSGRFLMANKVQTTSSFGAAGAGVSRDEMDGLLDSTVTGWRFRQGEAAGAESPDFDDSDWELVEVGHQWSPENSTCWYRKRITIPERINGAPVAGSTLRLRAGMDNEAKAYVNGEFKQQFRWDDGDFVLTENARPGEVICVALYGINRPGTGSLYQAYLVSTESETLPQLLHAYQVAESYIHHASAEDAKRWQAFLDESEEILAGAAQRSTRRWLPTVQPPTKPGPYLDLVKHARAVLLSDAKRLQRDLRQIGSKLDTLHKRLRQGKAIGRQMAYQRVDARVVESFLQYVRDDMADGDTSHAVRALWTVRFLDQVCNEALRGAAAILENPLLDLAGPAYRTGPVVIRDGAFWQNDRPVFFTGVGHFDQVRRDTPILAEYGLSMIEIDLGPNSVLTGPGAVDLQPIYDLLKVLDDAAAHNVAVNLHTAPHYLPGWVFAQNPELGQCGRGFIPFCIEAQQTRAVHEQYLRTLMPLIAGHPALHSICLSNEPTYTDKCAYSRTKFHAYIKDKHGSIESANALYGTSFASFDDVPIPEEPSNYPLYFDWCRFNQDRFVDWHAFMRDIVHEYNPRVPVLVKVMSTVLDPPRYFALGINHEDFNALDSIAGNDCHQLFAEEEQDEYARHWHDVHRGELAWRRVDGEQNEYAQHWQGMALNYTFQRSTAPASVIYNAEDHVIRDGDWSFIPDSHIRTAFWTQALHGQGAATTWVWDRDQRGNRAGNILTRANCVRAMGHAALDLNRLAREVYALQHAKSDLAIFYSQSSLLPSAAHVEGMAATFEGTYFVDTTCDIVTERLACGEASKLGNYKVVVVPQASHVPDDVAKAFQGYITSGGLVMTVGECFTHDEYGRARGPALKQAGSGQLVAYPGRLTARAYREILDSLLDKAGCDRPVRIAGEHGEPIWGVNLRTAEHDGKRLVSLVNFSRSTQTVVLKTVTPITKAIDLFDNAEMVLPITIRPMAPVLLSTELGASANSR